MEKLIFAVVLLVTTCASCARGAYRTQARRESDMLLSAVEVSASCPVPGSPLAAPHAYHGSGVIISPRRILTAAHVVPCANGLALVTDVHGRVTPVHVEVLVPFADLARLVASDPEPFAGLPAAHVGPPVEEGQRVCLASAVPERARRCGRVVATKDFPPANLKHTAETQPGNSGGGIYDSRGRLVGVITHTILNPGGPPLGGLGTALDGMDAVARDFDESM